MAIVFLRFPPRCAAAFNPIRLIVQTPKARYAQLLKDLETVTVEPERSEILKQMESLVPYREQGTLDPVMVEVSRDDGARIGKAVIERAPDSEGKAEIDLSYLLRRAFVNFRRISNSEYAEYDSNLTARYNISDSLHADPVFSAHVMNAVRQFGHADEGGIEGFGMQTRTRLVRYPGYPLAVTFRQIPYSGHTFRLTVRNVSWTGPLPTPAGNVHVAGKSLDFDRLVICDDQQAEVAAYEVETGCVPLSPFYVRWINTNGGWDYHMFECREKTSEVGDLTSIQREAADRFDTQTTVSVSASETVTVGEGMLERDEYLILAALARSPRIEWYDEEIGAWRVIVLADEFSSTWNARNGFGEVAFTFALPRMLTQF